MQVEPGEPDVFDPVLCLEREEVWCDEGLIGGVLDPVSGQFAGRGHGHDEAVGGREEVFIAVIEGNYMPGISDHRSSLERPNFLSFDQL